ncbi:MAG: MarR family transcriptional regulator [Ilumatobacteraceae bacterium]
MPTPQPTVRSRNERDATLEPISPDLNSAGGIAPTELARTLRLSINRLARRLRQQDRTGLGPTITAALASIGRGGGVTHGELAAIEQLAPPSITAIVAKLAALGLVTREVDEQDRRVNRIRITAQGLEQLDDVRTRRAEWLEGQLRSLTADELGRLAAAADVLAKLTDSGDTQPER